jgi:hypothetical protein
MAATTPGTAAHPPVGDLPLASLTRIAFGRSGARCPACSGHRVTSLSMVLGEGTAVRLDSCHGCGTRTWQDPAGTTLPVDRVVELARAG